MGKRKSTEEEVAATCQSIAKKLASLAEMMQDGRLSDALTANLLTTTVISTEPKKHRGPKPAKDPLAPTRNLTSYIHYTNDNRKKIVDANPGMAPRDVARTLGEGWRGLNEKEKMKYDQLAKDDLKRYNDEMKAYKESISGGSRNNDNKSSDNSNSNDSHSDTSDSSSDEEDELASDDPTPKSKQSAITKPTPAKNADDASDASSSSSSSSSSSEESSSSSDSSDSDDEE